MLKQLFQPRNIVLIVTVAVLAGYLVTFVDFTARSLKKNVQYNREPVASEEDGISNTVNLVDDTQEKQTTLSAIPAPSSLPLVASVEKSEKEVQKSVDTKKDEKFASKDANPLVKGETTIEQDSAENTEEAMQDAKVVNNVPTTGPPKKEHFTHPQLQKAAEVAASFNMRVTHGDENNLNFDKLPARFQQCLTTGHISSLNSKLAGTNVLDRVKERLARKGDADWRTANLVATISKGFLKPTDERASRNVACYSKYQKYKYNLNEINNDDYKPYHFFMARWSSILDDYLGSADWTLAHDIDTINTNFSKPLSEVTSKADRADVILQVRSNTEVIAGFVMVRGDSLFGACFLDYWMHFDGEKRRPNDDNGALLEVVMTLLDPSVYEACKPKRSKDYFKGFMPCFVRTHKHFADSMNKIPIKIMFPFEGLWRSLERPPVGNIVSDCYASDGFGHGMKKIGEHYVTDEEVECNLDDPSRAPVLTGNPRCKWLDPAYELSLMKECCYFRHPLCTAASPETGGKAACGSDRQCDTSERGRHGTGICNEDTKRKSDWAGLI